ncbi:Na+/H+ antiporter NhaC [Propionigenium maris DSM 9537]|uniref:Na+/H+ antiporter NhaC n=1 Tax=Propionigenium maris DSM 9537 TaxID=1123000 RepID=A0A9W6LLP9_9FUSO|nr:Na+/H+ antiporter NhaC [Propionigenium maris]GLI55516.1 Na+/H+ antiporter NhaC [Propionigenium maris DSM 9537]
MSSSTVKETKLSHALIPLTFLIGSLVYAIQFAGLDPHLPIFMSGIVAAGVAVFGLGYKWKNIQEGVVDTIKMSMEAILILMIIGMVVGTWILSGVVPTMIFYGLKIISPAIFLPATLIICAIVSIATGSSWSTAATVGIALMGVGTGLGIPPQMTAGAIISGAYMGDKLSPLSDTTNLAPAMAGAKLFDHIRHMLYTTTPSFIISLVLFAFLGMKYAGAALDINSINEILGTLSGNFNINPVLFLVPVLTIAMVVKKVPAVPGLFGGALLGGIFAMMFQGASVGDVFGALHYGFESATGNEMVDSLLSRGGMDSMMWTISLIICALFFGGVMERTGMLGAVAAVILKRANTTGKLVLSTVLTPMFVNTVAGDQYLSIVVPGRMFKNAYTDRGLHPKNLSRALEDSGTLTSPLIPWNTCGAYMIATLGIAPWIYVPYCFLNLLNPVISVFYGYTGITMEALDEETAKELKADALAD